MDLDTFFRDLESLYEIQLHRRWHVCRLKHICPAVKGEQSSFPSHGRNLCNNWKDCIQRSLDKSSHWNFMDTFLYTQAVVHLATRHLTGWTTMQLDIEDKNTNAKWTNGRRKSIEFALVLLEEWKKGSMFYSAIFRKNSIVQNTINVQ